MALQRYHLGCPIWSHKAWIGELFTASARPKDFLGQYASVFNTVEGNTTFYGLPSEATVARWRAETPEGFRFCFKFPRAISHDRRLQDAEAETGRFLDTLAPLKDRLGHAFLQLPPSFGPSELPALEHYLAALPEGFSCAVEVRHPGFFGKAETDLNTLLTGRSADRVIFDTRGLHTATTDDPDGLAAQRKKPRVPVRFTATGTHPFIRFVGHPEVDENLPLLAEWAPVVAQWIGEGRTPYIFMHAPDDFYAPRLARHFHRLLSEQTDAGDPPTWPAEADEPNQEQLELF